jgi:hypothetical protein
MGGIDDCDAGERCGGVWVHSYAEGTIGYDEDPEVHLVGYPGTIAGDFGGRNVSWGGDLDGDGNPELYVYSGYDYRTMEGGGSLFVVEVPESGTYSLVDEHEAYIAATDESADTCFGCITVVGHDFTGDDYDDLLVGSPSGSHAGRIYLFPGGPNGEF